MGPYVNLALTSSMPWVRRQGDEVQVEGDEGLARR